MYQYGSFKVEPSVTYRGMRSRGALRSSDLGIDLLDHSTHQESWAFNEVWIPKLAFSFAEVQSEYILTLSGTPNWDGPKFLDESAYFEEGFYADFRMKAWF